MPPSHSGGCGSASAETQVHACLRDTFFPQRETTRDPDKISREMLIYVWAQSQLRLIIKVWSWEEAPKVCLPVALTVLTTLEEFYFFCVCSRSGMFDTHRKKMILTVDFK